MTMPSATVRERLCCRCVSCCQGHLHGARPSSACESPWTLDIDSRTHISCYSCLFSINLPRLSGACTAVNEQRHKVSTDHECEVAVGFSARREDSIHKKLKLATGRKCSFSIIISSVITEQNSPRIHCFISTCLWAGKCWNTRNCHMLDLGSVGPEKTVYSLTDNHTTIGPEL